VQVLWKTHPWHLGVNDSFQMEKMPFACPVCGRKTDYPVTKLVEGAVLTCPFCKLTLTLHSHMWKDVQKEIEKLKDKA
jgi:transcription elongation factor Elf1